MIRSLSRRLPFSAAGALLLSAALTSGVAFAQTPAPANTPAKAAPPASVTAPAAAPAKATPAPAPKPAAAPAANGAAAKAEAERIDINSASAEELASLKGIGPARAQAIIQGRPYNGRNDLERRNIIPQAVYNSIKDLIVARQR